MARTKFRDLDNTRPAEARARVEARVQRALAEMPTLENRSDEGRFSRFHASALEQENIPDSEKL